VNMKIAGFFLSLAVITGIAGPACAQGGPGGPAPTTPTAQAPTPAQPAPAAPVPAAPAAPPAPVAQPAPPPSNWPTLPRMQLERQFAGPLQDTVIQRWRDPADGTVCYLYLPITAAHSLPTASGYVEYGANTIGSISCLPNLVAPEPAPKRR